MKKKENIRKFLCANKFANVMIYLAGIILLQLVTCPIISHLTATRQISNQPSLKEGQIWTTPERRSIDFHHITKETKESTYIVPETSINIDSNHKKTKKIHETTSITPQKSIWIDNHTPSLPPTFLWKEDVMKNVRSMIKKLENHLQHKGMIIVEGHAAEMEAQQMEYIKILCCNVTSVAEIGFNAGHSMILTLLSNPKSEIQAFDLGSHKYAYEAFSFIKTQFPTRKIDIEWGDSTITVPEYNRKNPQTKFDVLIVDGGHTHDIAVSDIKNMQKLAHHTSLLIVDDTPCKHSYCVGSAIQEMDQTGFITDIKRFPVDSDNRGFTTARYTLPKEEPRVNQIQTIW